MQLRGKSLKKSIAIKNPTQTMVQSIKNLVKKTPKVTNVILTI